MFFVCVVPFLLNFLCIYNFFQEIFFRAVARLSTKSWAPKQEHHAEQHAVSERYGAAAKVSTKSWQTSAAAQNEHKVMVKVMRAQ